MAHLTSSSFGYYTALIAGSPHFPSQNPKPYAALACLEKIPKKKTLRREMMDA
jgi:hypothetical protein